MKLHLQRAKPSPALKPFVDHYKYIETDLAGTMKAIPSGSKSKSVLQVPPGFFLFHRHQILLGCTGQQILTCRKNQ